MSTPDYRMWSRPLVASDNVVVVTPESLILGRVKLDRLPQAEPLLVRGEGATAVISLGSVTEILVVDQQPELRVVFGQPRQYQSVFVETIAVRDELLRELARRLGPSWTLSDRDQTQGTTLLILALILGGLTLGLFLFTREAEARTPTGVGFELLADSLGSLGVVLVGGLLSLTALIGSIWLIRNPPRGARPSLTRKGS